MATQTELDNIAVLTNASHLVAEIVLSIAGNDISNHLNGSQIDSEAVTGIAMATFNKELGGVNNA